MPTQRLHTNTDSVSEMPVKISSSPQAFVHCWNISAVFFFMFCKSFACCILLTPCIKYSQKPHKSFFADFVTSALDVRMCKQFYFALNTVWRHCRQLSRGNLLNNLTHKKHANSAQSTACYGNQTTCCGLFVILSTAVTTDGGISPRLWCL